MHLLQAYGVPVAETEIKIFGKQHALSVKRFDRQMHSSGKWILRVPQEDFCQVMGLPSHKKYETKGDRG